MQEIKKQPQLVVPLFQEFWVFEAEQGTVKEAFSLLLSASPMAMIGNAYYGIVQSASIRKAYFLWNRMKYNHFGMYFSTPLAFFFSCLTNTFSCKFCSCSRYKSLRCFGECRLLWAICICVVINGTPFDRLFKGMWGINMNKVQKKIQD